MAMSENDVYDAEETNDLVTVMMIKITDMRI